MWFEQEWDIVTLKRRDFSGSKPSPVGTHDPVVHNLRPNMRLTLEAARLKHRLTTAQLAERIYCAHDRVRDIEAGHTIPNHAEMRAIEELFGIKLFPCDVGGVTPRCP